MDERGTSPTESAEAFHLLAKPTGAACNLSCRYCFYLHTDALYPGSDFRMKDNVLQGYVRQYIQAQPVSKVTIGWQGGEPTLMGLDFFRRAVEYQAEYRKPGMTVLNTIQTNGILLDDEWGRFFRQHRFLVGLSLDGPRELHDAYRVDRGGQGTFDRVMDGLRTLQEHGVDFNILTTVNAANAEHALQVYRFLRDEAGARFIQFIPIVERAGQKASQGGDPVSQHSVKAGQYGAFLGAVFDEWVRRDVGRVFVQIFDVALAAWAGAAPSLCIFSPTCGNAPVLEHNGDLYSCDHFVHPQHLLGNILNTPLAELMAAEGQRQFSLDKRDRLPQYCRQCDVRFACNGGCPKDRFVNAPDGEEGLNYLCPGYREFFHHIDYPMKIMADLLRLNRPPAEVMRAIHLEDARLDQAYARAGRNDQCPCGSGRKFKRCHGQTAQMG